MGEACPVVFIKRREKDLRFMHESAKRFRMDDTIPISLKLGTILAAFNRHLTSAGIRSKKGKLGEHPLFPFHKNL
jgi:hypothetical protein